MGIEPIQVLIAEDNAVWRRELTEALCGAGFVCTTIDTYEQAIDVLERREFPLVVLDMSLKPDDQWSLDGLRILNWLYLQNRKTRVILVSGYQETIETLMPTLKGYEPMLRGVIIKRNWNPDAFTALARQGLCSSDEPTLLTPSPQAEESTIKNPPRRLNGYQVLIVEDDRRWQPVLAESLKGKGYAVSIAASYERATARIQHNLYHVVIVDFQLADNEQGNADGYLMLKYLGNLNLPVVVVTGLNRTDLVDGAWKQGIFDCLSKRDFDADDFIDTVAEAVRSGELGKRLKLLSPMERRVVDAFFQGITTDKELADYLWHEVTPQKERRVRDIVSAILKKLRLKGRAAIVPTINNILHRREESKLE